MGYAAGKHAYGICDKTGFRYKLKDLVYEYKDGHRTGFRVGRDVVDPDHPQNFLGRVKINDPQALKDPRPNRVEPYIVYVGIPQWEDPDAKLIVALGQVGYAFVLPSVEVDVASATGTGAVGTVTVLADSNTPSTGETASGSVGSVEVLPSIDVFPVSASGFGELSRVLFSGDVIAPVIYDYDGWGESAWSADTWGTPPIIPPVLGVADAGYVTVVVS